MQRLFHKMDTGKKYLILFTLLGIMGLLLSFKLYGYENTWRLWNIETLMPPFADLRVIPSAAATFKQGGDPTLHNAADPLKRVFNYPKIWYLLFFVNISQDDVFWMGMFLFALFYLGFILFPKDLGKLHSIFMVLVFFSPAAILLYERGNVDLMLFFLCAMALLTLNLSTGVTSLIILFGALLKIYPVLGMVILLNKGWKKLWPNAFFILTGLGIYVWLTFSNMKTVWATTPRGPVISYGVNVLFSHYQGELIGFLHGLDLVSNTAQIMRFTPYVIGLIVFLVVLLKGIRDEPIFHIPSCNNLVAFQMGAVIYVGTFLLGNNWDYRLIFLLFVIPQLVDWLSAEHKNERNISLIALTLIIVSSWHFLINAWLLHLFPTNEVGFIVDEIANWLLFAVLTYLCYASFPLWVKDFARNLKMLQWVTR